MAEEEHIVEDNNIETEEDSSDDPVDEDIELDIEDDSEEPPEEDEEEEDELDAEIEKKKSILAGLDKGISEAKYKLHKTRQQKQQEKKEEDPPLTREQLKALYTEHKDDPDTAFAIMEHMAKLTAKGESKEALNAAEISKTKSTLEAELAKEVPEINEEGSEVRVAIDDFSNKLFLNDHPLKDVLAYSMLQLTNMEKIQQAAFEAGKKEALGKTADENLKKKVKDNDLTPKGKKTSTKKPKEWTPDMEDVAKRIGLKTKRQKDLYLKLLGNNNAVGV